MQDMTDIQDTEGKDRPADAKAEKKSLNLRLEADQADKLAIVAQIDGVAITQAIRDAIDDYIEERAADEEFRRRSRAVLERQLAILEELTARADDG